MEDTNELPSRSSPPADNKSSTAYVHPDDDPNVPSPPFHELIMLFEDISKKRSEKSQYIRRYFRTWREKKYGNMFSVIRLILPQLDRERGRYGLKEQKISDLYISSLNILPGSDTARKLKNWKDGSGDSTGDFSLVVREVVASRSLVTQPQGHTVQDVNKILTELSRRGSDNSAIFKTFVQSFTPLENKWLVRIINKDLKLGVSENTILPCYHQDAVELFNVCSDLRKTLMDCADPNVRVSTSTVNLSQPFKPMLSKRLPSPKDVVESMGNMPFWIETKLDGERVQVHKDGENYRYWSRNSTEYTHLYGATPNEGSLTPFLHALINPKVEKLILDGEMVEYDPATKSIINFGTVKTAGGDHSSDSQKRRPFLFVFDVLYMNGASIIDQPLESRRDMLPSIIPKESEGRVEILKYLVGSTEQHIIEAIDAAIISFQEGVIVKNPRSAYTPNGRGQDWIKIKPEYVDGVFNSLDVLIVGGYYGSGSRSGNGAISSYLCAVRDNTSHSPNGKEFVSFCKFGSGFTYQQMGKFGQLLGPHWKEYKHYKENPWVEMIDNAKMRPDVIIDPAKSIVVEVKASEIVPNSDSYAADYTLRFPRFLSVRQDKDATSCMTLSEVHRMFREFKGKLSTKQVNAGGAGSMSRIKKKLAGPRRATQAHLLHAIIGDMTVVKVETDLFKGQVFWVLRGDEQQSKPELEVLIKRFGGKQSQSDQMENAIIIAGLNGPDLFGLKKKGQRNIVLPTWIRDCVQEQRLIPLNPKYMVFATKETERKFRKIMDGYNDSYIEPLTVEGLQEILDGMPSRSNVVKRRRLKTAQERADKIKVKRLNNLEDQPDPSLIGNSEIDVDEKETILQLELDNADGDWEVQDTERARKIAAELTRRYYGHEGEQEPPLGMFQGLEVFIVYPPTPAEYLKSLTSLQPPKKSSVALGKEVKREDGYEGYVGRYIDGFQGLDNTTEIGENIFDIMTKSIDLWSESHEKGISELLEKLDRTKVSKDDDMNWTYFQEDSSRRDNLDLMLRKLSNYQLCRNNLEIVTQILEYHGARIIPQDQCTIETCQRMLRARVGLESKDSTSKIIFNDVGVPLEIVVLFDPLYLETLDQWKKALRVSVLYGPNANSFEVPRLVTSDWVKQSQKSEYRIPEEGYYPVE